GRGWFGEKVCGSLVRRNIEVNVMTFLLPQDRFDLRKIPVGWSNQTSQTHVGPNDGRVGMPLEDGFYLVEVGGFGFVFRNVLGDRDVDIIVQYDQQTDFRSEIEYSIESLILKACDLSWNLC